MKMLLIELNEFNEPLLREACLRLHLRHVERLLQLQKCETWTDDVYESDYLEPWVQWVSIHTGLPSGQHQVKHLGDVPEAGLLQLWEKLSEKNISSGIWGAMNARKKQAANCSFFLPDPWTISEEGFPDELNALLIPLRYIATNYTKRSLGPITRQIGQLIRLFKKHNLGWCLVRETFFLLQQALFCRGKPFVFISFLDYLSTRLFLQYKARLHPSFSLIFLNSIAHLQHHEWKGGRLAANDPLAHGFRNIDRILGHVFDQIGSDEVLIVTNALSQKNTSDETAWILYRQIDQQTFLRAVGIQDAKVESHMTHDAHLFFPHPSATQKAHHILQHLSIHDRPLFHVEIYPNDPLKLFYRIQFTGELEPNAHFQLFDRSYPFFDLFTAVVKRTGKHTQQGTLFCNRPIFPSRMLNHEICDRIVQLFQNCQRNEPVIPQSR